eukprot:4628505-Prymnesium_polylepis.2
MCAAQRGYREGGFGPQRQERHWEASTFGRHSAAALDCRCPLLLRRARCAIQDDIGDESRCWETTHPAPPLLLQSSRGNQSLRMCRSFWVVGVFAHVHPCVLCDPTGALPVRGAVSQYSRVAEPTSYVEPPSKATRHLPTHLRAPLRAPLLSRLLLAGLARLHRPLTTEAHSVELQLEQIVLRSACV